MWVAGGAAVGRLEVLPQTGSLQGSSETARQGAEGARSRHSRKSGAAVTIQETKERRQGHRRLLLGPATLLPFCISKPTKNRTQHLHPPARILAQGLEARKYYDRSIRKRVFTQFL